LRQPHSHPEANWIFVEPMESIMNKFFAKTLTIVDQLGCWLMKKVASY